MDELTLHIIQTAAEKFFQFGIRSVSIDDICNELRISKKTFYRIFPRKEDLIESVLHNQSSFMKDKFEKLYRGKNAIDSLILIIKEVKKHSEIQCSAFYYDMEKYYPAIFHLHKEKKTEWIRVNFEKNLRQGIAEGYYREDLDIELSSIFHAIQLKNANKDIAAHIPKISLKRLNDFYIDVIVRLITNEKGLKYVEEQIK
jgi:AcrR family transcriptional regulator